MDETHAVPVLWTGGWDSTFRICQLSLELERRVQPYYVIEPERRSTLTEIRTMSRLRRMIAIESREAAARIQDTLFICLDDIEIEGQTGSQFRCLSRRGAIGTQYKWLSALARQRRIDGLELSVHRDDRAHQFLLGCVEPVNCSGLPSYRLVSGGEDPCLELFRPFSLPLFHMTKVAMREHAERGSWGEILHATWFCFMPVRGQPCGLCNPCHFAMTEGMAYRLPPSARFRYRLRPLLYRAPQMLVRFFRRLRGTVR